MTRIALCAAATLLTSVLGTAVPADDQDDVTTVEWTIHPAALSRPVLKHRLYFSELETHAGNAAPLYLRAAMMRTDSHVGNDHDAWQGMPPDELPLDKVRELVHKLRFMYEELGLAARRQECTWETPLFEAKNPFDVLLPEMQRMRELARLLDLKARMAAAEGDWPQVLDTLRVMMTMGRHVGRQPTLIGGLVGLAIESIAVSTLGELLQHQDAPNMYWPLAALPRPLVDMRAGYRYEAISLYVFAPELRGVRTAQLSDAQWRDRQRTFAARMKGISSWANDQGGEQEFLAALKQFEETGPAYGPARKRLLAAGYTEDQLDAMSRSQLLLVDVVELFDAARDEVFKVAELPFPESQAILMETSKQVEESSGQGLGGSAVRMLLPLLHAVRIAQTRTQAQVDALRIVQALRLYAAEHGRLPARLEDISQVPIPNNPFSGEPFGYRLEGATAALDAPAPTAPSSRRYRLRLP